MKKLFSFILALSVVASVFAQDLAQYEELMQVKFNNGNAKDLNIRLSADVPAQYVLPEEYEGGTIVEREVETFYSGKKTLRMLQQQDGTYVLVDPERCTYTLEGLAKSEVKKREIQEVDNAISKAYAAMIKVEKSLENKNITEEERSALVAEYEKLNAEYNELVAEYNELVARHTASFIKNAQPKMDADGDWDFFELKQVGVLGYEPNDSVDLDTCKLDYVFCVEKNGKYLYSSPTWGEAALRDTVSPVEMIINLSLDRDSTYTFIVIDKEYNHLPGDTIYKFDFVADKSGRIEFPDSNFIKGYVEIGRVPNHAFDIHYVMDMTHVYYKEVHGRNSFDGKGAPIYTFVDFNDPIHYGEWTNNAAASAAEPHFVAVGCGTTHLGGDLTNFGSFDLLAHEYAHLVVAANGRGGMETSGEAGALNEAIADCMSVAADFYINGEKANWQIAEGVATNGVPNMRDLSNPKMSGGGVWGSTTLSYPQPDTYGGENWIDPSNMSSDNGGIHFNNGVFNYWFYLLTEGGNGVNDLEQAYEVKGIGIKNTEKLLMHIILNYLKPKMDYSQMRIASQSAAADIFGASSEELKQVHNAWFAVGVADRTPAENIDAELLNVYSVDGRVIVEAEAGNMIDVYSIVGQHIVSLQAQEGFTTIPVVNNNVIIVKVGNNVQKVIVK